jgi:hypothetical protein
LAEYTHIHICRYHPELADPFIDNHSQQYDIPIEEIDIFDVLGLETKRVSKVKGLGTIALIHSILAHSIQFVHLQACLPGKHTKKVIGYAM